MGKKKPPGGGQTQAEQGNSGSQGQTQASPIEDARGYIMRKWAVVPVKYRSKEPIRTAWQTLNINLKNVGEYFNSGPMNIGVQLGPRSNFLTDGDLDCPEALVFASYFLPPTHAVFGRASKPRSHWLYYCDDPPEQARIAFVDDHGKTILELRFGGGGSGAQTVFPNSVHKDTGEVITWDEKGEPGRASHGELYPGAVKVACATLLMRGWPGQGSRHTAALIVGGFLARVGWELEAIKELISAVAKEAGDDDISNRVQAAKDSFENLARGDEHIYGFPALREMFGEAPAKLIAKWVGYRDDGSELLTELNEKFCVLPIGGKTRIVTWGKDPDFPGYETIAWSSSLADFKALHDKYLYTYRNRRTGEDVTVRRGTWYVKNPGRRQYDGGMRFMPNIDEPVVNDTLNLWRDFRVAARKPEGKSGAAGCKLFLDHGLKIICSGDEEHYDYLIKREAFIAQKRMRSEVAVALRTKEEGTGKGFWCRTLNHLYGVHAMQVQNADHVIGKYNPHLEKLLRLTADEALFALDPKHRNALYYLITDPRITIEPKHVNVYTADNHLNIDIISNADHFIPVSGTARRFMVPIVSSARASDHKYFAKITAQLDDGGYEALLYHLLHEVDIKDFNVRAVPKTAALLEQAAYSRKGVDLLVEAACNEGVVPCRTYWPDFSDCTAHLRPGFDYWIRTHSDNELRRMGPLMVKRRLANEWGCITGKASRKQEDGKRTHGVLWPPLAELRTKFIAKYGQQTWLCPDVTEWQKVPTEYM